MSETVCNHIVRQPRYIPTKQMYAPVLRASHLFTPLNEQEPDAQGHADTLCSGR